MFTYNTNGTVSKERVFTGEVISITYDTVGNPTGYYNGAAMTWQKGRQLATYTSGGTTTSYTYDMTGQRVRKTVGSTVHDFVSEGGRVVADLTPSATLIFGYDESGHAATMNYNGTTY